MPGRSHLSFPKHLLILVLCLCVFSTAPGAVILIIDLSDPTQARFSATGAFAENDDLEETYLQEGFTLLGFFRTPLPWEATDFLHADESTLYSPGGPFAYGELFTASLSGTTVDLNIAGSGAYFQDFSTNAPALEGYLIADLSDWHPYLKPGATGDILAGDFSYNTVVIGQFQVIPEPGASWLLLGAALLIGLGWRIRLAR